MLFSLIHFRMPGLNNLELQGCVEYKPSPVSVLASKTNGFIPLFYAMSCQIGNAFTLADSTRYTALCAHISNTKIRSFIFSHHLLGSFLPLSLAFSFFFFKGNYVNLLLYLIAECKEESS